MSINLPVKVIITDAEYPDVRELELPILEAAGFQVELAQCRNAADVIQVAQGAAALITQYAPISREAIEALPSLRIVTRYGVGVDTIDLQAAKERGIWVANVPDYGVEEVASHTYAMLLALLRHLPFYDRDVKRGIWHYQRPGLMHRPSTLTLGVIGLGRIGRLLASYAQANFGRIIGYDPFLPDAAWPAGVRQETLAGLLRQSNAISLHMPLNEETRNLVDRGFLNQLLPGSYLVNASRGGLIDLDALLEALDNGQLSAAGLDVLPQEPPPPDHPILSHPRVILSPHVAWYSEEAGRELRRKAALNIVDWAEKGRPTYVVVAPHQ